MGEGNLLSPEQIHGRVKISGMDYETVKLLTVFPAEIWDIILEEPEDLEYSAICAKASPAFDNLLRPKVMAWQMAQGLRIMGIHIYLNFKDSKTILNCRLVCSAWKRGIDYILQTLPYNFTIGKYNKILCLNPRELPIDVHYRTSLTLYNFSADKLEQEILPAMDSPYYRKHCPCSGRHLYISAHIRSEKKAALTKAFLDKIGKQFWHLSYSSSTSSPDWFKNLVEFVRRMPNLKSLSISNNPPNFLDRSDFFATSEVTEPS